MDNTTSIFYLSEATLKPKRLVGISVAILPGVTAILGASGAGKTSLLNLLAGYEEPTSGSIERPAKIFWAPQDGGLWPGMSVREHLSVMTRDETAIKESLEAFELGECARQVPATLSRGQQARLTVARALLADATALVMDEPLAHIDTNRRSAFWSAIRQSITQRDQSLVFATHEPELALSEAEHVVCLKSGKCCFSGNVTDLYWNATSAGDAAFLGPANWVTDEVRTQWFADEVRAVPHCLRPEQLQVNQVAHENAAITVKAVSFRGSHEELQLQHLSSAECRTFWHRPKSAELKSGAAVTLFLR
ncbi:MAG: iron(III) transport system ATP-binding protein [Verrucomicrobiales bacterium]|jgi:iron(III) transport system ATP-binding protein